MIAILTTILCDCGGYDGRRKVVEGLGLLAGLKTPAEEWLLKHNRFPSVASLGGKTGGKYSTNIGLEGDFSYSARFLDPKLTGKLVFSYDPKTKMWDCSKNTTVPEKYLPSNCLRK
jgi:type IV pilus assembly protein PilA